MIKCDVCGGTLFRTVLILRKVSKFTLSTPTDGLLQIPIFRCDDCNTPHYGLIPRGAGDKNELFNLRDDDE